MSETDKLARMIRIMLFIFAAFGLGVYISDIGKDDSDGPHSRSGMNVYVDAKTGCEYVGNFGGITPRMNVAGKQEGCR